MTHFETLSIILTGIGLLLAIMGTGLGMLVRITRRWTQIEERLAALVDSFREAMDGASEDYNRLERRLDRTDSRLDRHEEYHASLPGARP